MRIEVRSDKVIIDGYVNAVGRDSRPVIVEKRGKVVEQIVPGTFNKAIKRAKNVKILLNHMESRTLGSTQEGTLKLYEDSIGLRAHAEITDAEVIEKAKNKELRGWSFGMYVLTDEYEERADKLPRRLVSDIELYEVSIIDSRMKPVYAGTSIEQRAEIEVIYEQRAREAEFEMVETPKETVDYANYEARIKELAEKENLNV